MKTTRVPVVVLKLPRTAGGIQVFAESVLRAMTDNPAFPHPPVPLAVLAADIDEVGAARAHCLTRTKGAREERDVKLQVLKVHLDHLRAYVEEMAWASPEEALAIIASAGMDAKRVGMRTKVPFEARPGRVSGSVRLVARAVARQASYAWEFSLDGETWNDAQPTLQADTTVYGFARGARVHFRYRPLYRGGPGDLSQVVTLFVP